MRVAVIGAGIAGISTAFELASDGHEVSVFERRASVAAEASFATAGLVAPAWAAALAPSLGSQLLRPRQSHAAVHLQLLRSPLGWAWKSWRARKSADDARAQMHELAVLGRSRQAELRRRNQLDYERTDGLTVLLRGPRELAAAQAGIALLTAWGVPHKLLEPAQVFVNEPRLNAELSLHAAIHLPQDEAGNCRQYAHLLRIEAQRLGVRFRFHTTVRKIEAGAPATLIHEYTPPAESSGANSLMSRHNDAGDTLPMELGPQLESFDAIVVCASASAAQLLRPLGLKLPLLTVGGYSLTAPLRQLDAHPDLGPRSALVDARYQVAVTRLGQRVRVAGITECGGGKAHSQRALTTLHKVLHDLFPGAAQPAAIQHWRGTRALLPSGRPLIGSSGLAGVWLNIGHGEHGWPLAGGAARVLTEQIAGRPAPLDIAALR